MLKIATAVIVSLSLALSGCSGEKENGESAGAGGQQTEEPDYVTVQHILIGFTGSVPGKTIQRTKEEAEQLAAEVLARAQAGEDFDALVRQYTDDAHPGIYKMANYGAPGDMSQNVFPRGQMVSAFGDVGFPLDVGRIAMASYDAEKSPFGWHIIKRVE